MASSPTLSPLPHVTKEQVLRNLLRLDDIDATWVLNEYEQVRFGLPQRWSPWLVVWKWLASPSNPRVACAVASVNKILQRASMPWLARLRDETNWRWNFLRTFDPPSSVAFLDSTWALQGWQDAFRKELIRQPEGVLPALSSPYYPSTPMQQTWGRLRFHPAWSSSWSFTIADSHPGQYRLWPTRSPLPKEINLDVAKGSVLIIRSLECKGRTVDPPVGITDYRIQGRGDTITMGELVEGVRKYYSRWPRSTFEGTSCTVSKPVLLPNGRKLQVDFQPGVLGMDVDWSSGTIRSVEPAGQAGTLGVEIGMRCLQFNGCSKRPEDMKVDLEDALARGSSFSMTFVMMDGSWRANIN